MNEVDFLPVDKHESFPQVDFNVLGIKYFLQGDAVIINRHSLNTQSSKFVISLQYLKKEVKNGVHYLH